MLLSVGSVNFHKKDCHKMCDHTEKSKSQVGGSFGGPENLAILRKILYALEATQNNMVVRNPGLMAVIIVWNNIC